MRSFLTPLFVLALAACSSSIMPPVQETAKDAGNCLLPAGQQCCDGDVFGSYSCDAKGGVVCSSGTRLTPSNECRLPPPRDAGPDAHDSGTCLPPTGFECCDGDVLGTSSCGEDGGVVCSAGTRLTPSNECTIAPPLDGGNDAADAQDDAPADAPHE